MSVWSQGDKIREEVQGAVDGTACPSLSHSTDLCARQPWGPRLSAQPTHSKRQTSCRCPIFHSVSISLMCLGEKLPHVFSGGGQGRNVLSRRDYYESLPF